MNSWFEGPEEWKQYIDLLESVACTAIDFLEIDTISFLDDLGNTLDRLREHDLWQLRYPPDSDEEAQA